MANDEVRTQPGRRRFLTATTAVVGAVGVGFVAVPFIKSWNPSARAKLAGAPVDRRHQRARRRHAHGAGVARPADLDRQAHPEQMLDVLPTLDGRLRDPKSDNPDQQPDYAKNELRSIKPEISVLVGICTHLGCSPEMVPRSSPSRSIRTGRAATSAPATSRASTWPAACSRACPAPINLLVPPHHYENDTTIVIGVDPPKGAA